MSGVVLSSPRRRMAPALMALCSLTGCANQPADVPQAPSIPAPVIAEPTAPIQPPPAPADKASGKLAQCTRELDALRAFNAAQYVKYHHDLDQLTQSSAQYLSVANDISNDINELVRPRYQYALASLCYHIRSDLSDILIKQVTPVE